MATQQDIIKKFMKSLDETTELSGKAATDAAFKAASDDSRRKFNSMQEVIDAFLTDCENTESADQFLREKCGIILDNEDNGSITGLDAGSTKIKTDESIVPENTFPTDLVELYRNADIPDTLTEEILLSSSEDPDLKIVPHNSGTISEKILYKDLQFTKKGLTVTVQNYNGIIESAESGDDEATRKLIVINGLYSWWIENALQLIEDSYGKNFSFSNESSASTKEILIKFINEDSSTTAAVRHNYSTLTPLELSKMTLEVNMHFFATITSSDTNGKGSDRYLDCSIAHELTHGIMAANMSLLSYRTLPAIIIEGLAELTIGIDKWRSDTIVDSLEEHRKTGYLSTILDYESGYENNSLCHPSLIFADKNKKDEADNRTRAQYAGGYMLLRYFAKQCATEDPATALGANQSITCALEEGLLVKANNGTAALQKGDALVTDDYGNIATIKIGNENNIISTPESKSMVVVKNHSGKNIASIFGSASVHDNGFIQKNFSAIDVKAQIDNATVVGSNEKDEIVIDGINASITSNDGDDIIKVNGNGAEILTSDGLNEITVTGDGAYINGGQSNDIIVLNGNGARNRSFYYDDELTNLNINVDISGGIFANTGNDKIFLNGDNNQAFAGDGNDSITVSGDENTIKGDLGEDKFIFIANAKNNTITDFTDDMDELRLSEEIAAEVKDESVVISSATTGETLVVLSEITSGSNDNIVYSTDDGNTVRTSIDWLLANTTPINPNPDDTVNHRIDVPVNGNVNNTRDDVIINAVSGDNVIQNSGNNVIITGGTDKDEVSNNANNVTVDGKAGNDVLSNGSAGSFPITHVRESFNGGDSVIINGGIGADLIYNYLGVNVELRGGEDNDTIHNTGNNVQITGDSGNDEINNNGGDTVTVDGGDGKDTLFNSGKSVSIFGGNGEDSIRINASGANATVNGGNDDDNISNYGSNALIDGGSGNDYLYNRGTDSTINGGMGNDSISNPEGSRVLLYGDEDNDEIRNGAENVTIDGGAGDDSIDNNAANVSIFGGDGKDTITHRNGQANNVTIKGGAGNDSISNLVASGIIINGGEDNDSINNRGNNVTIDGGMGDDSIINAGEQVIIEAGEGNDTINNVRKEVSINGGTGADFIENDQGASNVTIDGDDGDDFIKNNSSNSLINAGDGNDIIRNEDKINFIKTNSTIFGGAGNDSISNANWDVTINGGTGDDTIDIGGGRVSLNYSNGDGNDVINGFHSNDTLAITGNEYSLKRYDRNTIILTVGEGNITLHGDGELSIFDNIIGTLASDNNDKPDTTPADTTPADTTPADTTPADTTPADTTPADTTPADTTPADTTPADTTPADTTPADTTPADTTPADTTPSGQDQVAPVQIIRNLTGIDINHLEKVIVTDTDSLDDIIAERTVWLNFSTDSSKGVQNVDLSKSPYRQVVSLEGGNQKVQFSDENGNVAIVDASATGSKNIIFGNGDDLGIFYSSDANIRATVGSGRDSIITDNNAHVRVDMTSSEGTKIIPYSGRIILDNYAPDSRAEIIIPDVTDITSAIKDNSIQLIGNEVRPNSSTRIQLNGSTNANIVNLSTEHGDTQKVGFTGINGGAVDAHELRGNFLLKGNYAENASDKQKRKPSTLISGNGHDTILAGARDFVDGGNGRNQIFLTPYDLRQIRDGATIASSGNGRNTIHGFHEGFGYDGDVIQVKDFNNLKFKFDTDGLLLTADDSRIKFDGIGITSATTDDSTNLLDTNRAELIQITNGSSTMRTAVAQTNQSILVQEDDYITPNAFFGNRSGLNFSEYSGSVEINLTDGTGKLGKWDATFKGINKLQAGNGMSTLIGDDTRNTLIAGTGYTSMWGGAGNDKLIGKGNSTDKDGRTTFFFFAGDGRDVISDFTFLTPENRYDGIDDRINVGNSDINNAYRAGNNVVVVFDQNSYLILEDAVGKDFQIANMIAKVDRNIAYDGLANCYVASGGSSLTVDSTVRSAEIWLDNSHGTQFFGNIRTLDASAVEGNTSLVGNEFDDTIIAGQGDSSLWGGFSPSNDLLIGGSSRNTFFYCMGNGNDTIQGINDKDSIILSDVSLDQIIETSITADSVSIRFNDGGSLQIQGTSDVTYQLADGSRYSANHEHLEWDSR